MLPSHLRQPLSSITPQQHHNHSIANACTSAASNGKEYELGYNPALLEFEGQESCFEEARARAWLRVQQQASLKAAGTATPAPQTQSRPSVSGKRISLAPSTFSNNHSSSINAPASSPPRPIASAAPAASAPPPARSPPPKSALASSHSAAGLAKQMTPKGQRAAPQSTISSAAPTTPVTRTASAISSSPNLPIAIEYRPATPTFFTRAAIDDVEAMFQDNNTGNVSMQVAAHTGTSLSFDIHADTGLIARAHETHDDEEAEHEDEHHRPSPPSSIGYSIREDTEFIIVPSSVSSTSSNPISVFDESISNNPQEAHEEEDEDDVDFRLKPSRFKSLSRLSMPAMKSSAASARATGQADVESTHSFSNFSRVSVAPSSTNYDALLLTPISEGRESTQSSVRSLASTRSSTSSLARSHTGNTTQINETRSISNSLSSPSNKPSLSKAPESPHACNFALSFPMKSMNERELQMHLIEASGFLNVDSVILHDGEAAFDTAALFQQRLSDFEIGDLWLRVERQLSSEQDAESQARHLRVIVNDIDASCDHVALVAAPVNLWPHFISHSIAKRMQQQQSSIASPLWQRAKQQLTQYSLISSTHAFSNVSISLSPKLSAVSLHTIIAAYERQYAIMDDTLIVHYCVELLSLVAVLTSLDLEHGSLNGEHSLSLVGEQNQHVVLASLLTMKDRRSMPTSPHQSSLCQDRTSILIYLKRMLGAKTSTTPKELERNLTPQQKGLFLTLLQTLQADVASSHDESALLLKQATSLSNWLDSDETRGRLLRRAHLKTLTLM